MDKKLLLQDLANLLVEQKGISKRKAEFFVRAFFDIIEEGIMQDNYVKVSGFGTTKLVEVSERESVNINTGERFQISGHSKITFTPDSTLKELVNRPFAHFSTITLNTETTEEELDKADTLSAEAARMALEAERVAEESTVSSETVSSKPSLVEEVQPETQPEKREEQSGLESEQAEKEDVPENGGMEEGLPHGACATAGDSLSSSDVVEKEEAVFRETFSETVPMASAASPVAPPDPTSAEIPEEPSDRANSQADNKAEALRIREVIEKKIDVTPLELIAVSEQPLEEEKEESFESEEWLEPMQPEEEIVTDASHHQDTIIVKTNTHGSERRNGWKTAFLIMLALQLVLVSYFAGYYRWFSHCPFLKPETVETRSKVGRQVTTDVMTSTQAPPVHEVSTAVASSPVKRSVDKKAEKATTSKPRSSTKTAMPATGRESVRNSQSAEPRVDYRKEARKYQQLPNASMVIVGTQSVHEMKVGENFYRLAKQVYGDRNFARYIIVFNQIENPDHVTVGQRIKLPKLIGKREMENSAH